MNGRRTAISLAAFTAAALAAVPALAGDSGGGVLFYGFGSAAKLRGLPVEVGSGSIELDPLKNKDFRLDNGGQLAGGGMQINGFVNGVRVGFGVSVFSVVGTTLRHAPLDHGFRVEASSAWGAGIETFVGYELLRGPVRPYLDLVGSFNAVSMDVDLMHPEYGRLGRTQYGGWLFGFGPRAGVSVPLGKAAFLDVSGTYSLVGMERVRVVGGIGFWAR